LQGAPFCRALSTLAYRTRKFLRRNRYSVTAAAVVDVAIVAETASSLLQARKAQRRFGEVRQLARFVMTDLNTGMQRIPGSAGDGRSTASFPPGAAGGRRLCTGIL
jgi:hypothetical protein